jgi:hypothetical protein
MVVVYGEARLDRGVAGKVKDIIADVDKWRFEDCC